MSAGYGIASFVDGFFKGRDIRHGWEDRKLDRERQKKLDQIQFNQDRRAQEDHDWETSSRQRQRADEDALRKAQEAALAATEGAMGATIGTDAPAPLGANPAAALPTVMPQQPPQHVLEIANNLAMDKAAKAAQPMPKAPNIPQDPRLAVAPASAPPANPNSFPDMNAALGAIGPDAVGYRQGQVDPRLAGAAGMAGGVGAKTVQDPISGQPVTIPPDAVPQSQIVPPMPMPKNAELVTTGPGPTGSGMKELYDMGAIPRRYAEPAAPDAIPMSLPAPDYTRTFGQDGGFVGDVGEIANRGRVAVQNIAPKAMEKLFDMANPALAGAKQVAAQIGRDGLDNASRYVFGAALPGAMPRAQGADPRVDMTPGTLPAADQSKAPVSPTGAGPRIANLPSNAPAAQSTSPEVKSFAEAVTEAAAAQTTPATQAAASATEAMGAVKGPVVTQAQRTRATDSFIEQYMKVGAPMVVEEMLRQGKLDQAKSFMEWIDTTKTKEMMRGYADFLFHSSMGNVDGALDTFVEIYNDAGWVPDGVTIDRAKSGAINDEKGNPTGLRITFNDEASGNSYEQVFTDLDQVALMASIAAAPENAFEIQQQFKKDQEAKALGAQEKADKAAKDRQKRIDDAFKVISELEGKKIGGEQKTVEQIRREAEAYVDGAQPEDPAAAGDVPLLYRGP